LKNFLFGLLMFVLGGALTFFFMRNLEQPSTHGPQQQSLATVSRRDISARILATGIIKPMVGAEVRVGSRISGVVQRLHVGIGDSVSQGQLLAELDTVELNVKLTQAKEALNMARAEFDFTALELQRKRDLSQEEMIAADELESAEKAYRLAEIMIKEAEADVQHARTQLGYARIHAPISGVVASVSTQEGETVAASFTTPTFVTIIDLDRLELWAYVDETDIGRVEVGQGAVFTVDTYPENEFSGKVLSIYPNAVIQNTVVNYIAIVQIGDRQGKILRPEMTTNVSILIDTRENVLAVPRRAIVRDRGKYLVRVQANGQIEEREVRVGWRDDAFTEILEGLDEGETVVIGIP
jgi:macrolide-specific efflux system membrane fusion protein